MCGQRADGAMEAEEIHTSQEVKMQAAAAKEKRRGVPENKGADDPEYENIKLNSRQQAKDVHSRPQDQGPARSRPPPVGAPVPPWLHRAILSLYVLLALTFAFCIILSALVLVKNSELSWQLHNLNRELWNVSSSTQDCQESQRQSWVRTQQALQAVKQDVATIRGGVSSGNQHLSSLLTDLREVNKKLEKISSQLAVRPPGPTPQ